MSHPTPKDIAVRLHAVANMLHANGGHAEELADALAARGYPASTGGTGSRSASNTTSVERTAGFNDNEDDETPITRKPNRWAHADVELDRLLELLDRAARATEKFIDDLFDHASDEDWLPAGSGNCLCCTNFVRPDYKHPNRRLRSGYCPACHQAWLRWRQHNYPDRAKYVHWRRAELLKLAEEREKKQRATA